MSDADRCELGELFAHEGWLRRIARGLVVEDGVDDLLQDVWLTSLAQPPRATTARAWLRAVMLNLFRDGWRSGQRRSLREARADWRQDRVGSPEELAARAELEAFLREAVAALKPQHRQMIVMRYFEDRSAAEIARALGLPAGTVRRRLKEGLDHLRARLDGRHDGRRERWARVLLPVLGPAPGDPRPEPRPDPAAGAPWPPRSWSTVAAGLLVGSAMVVVVGWLRARGADDGGLYPLRPQATQPRARPVKIVAGPVESGPRGGTIFARVRGPDGRPAAGVRLTLVDRARNDAIAQGSTGADGGFVFTEIPAGRYAVSAVGPAGASNRELTPLAAGTSLDVELALAGKTGALVGRIVDVRNGAGIAGATVAAANIVHTGTSYDVYATTSDDAGRYQLPLPIGRFNVKANARGFVETNSYEYATAAAHAVDLPLHPEGVIAGRLVDARTRRPIDVAEVTVTFDNWTLDGQRFTTSEIDADGRFRLAVPAGKYLVHARDDVRMASSPPLVVGPAAIATLELALTASPLLRGRIIATGGRAVAGVRVLADVMVDGHPARLAATTTSAADGSFAVGGLPVGPTRLQIRGAGLAPAQVELPAATAAARTPVDIHVVAGAILRGRVSAPGGGPIAHARVVARVLPGPAPGAPSAESYPKTFTDEGGHFELAELPIGQLWVTVRAPEGTAVVGPVELEAGEAREVDMLLSAPAFISGTVTSPDGRPAADIRIDGINEIDGRQLGFAASTFSDASGRFRLGPLASGTVLINLAWTRFSIRRGETLPPSLKPRRVVIAPGDPLTEITLVAPDRGATLTGLVTDPDGRPMPRAMVDAYLQGTGDERIVAFADRVFTDERGVFVMNDMLHGSYQLQTPYTGYAMALARGVVPGSKGIVLRLSKP